MLITSNRRAISRFSSTLSLPTRNLPAESSAISSSTGAIILHGPHHSAQKSTRTGSLDPLISSSNVESVRLTMVVLTCTCLLVCPAGSYPPDVQPRPTPSAFRRPGPVRTPSCWKFCPVFTQNERNSRGPSGQYDRLLQKARG